LGAITERVFPAIAMFWRRFATFQTPEAPADRLKPPIVQYQNILI
jgi:hypothetical protein